MHTYSRHQANTAQTIPLVLITALGRGCLKFHTEQVSTGIQNCILRPGTPQSQSADPSFSFILGYLGSNLPQDKSKTSLSPTARPRPLKPKRLIFFMPMAQLEEKEADSGLGHLGQVSRDLFAALVCSP